MKVILLTELPGKGGEGDVVDVARGFYNNYLGPNKMAILATKGNLKQLEQRRGNIAKREEKRLAEANELKAALEGKTIKVEARVGEEGVLFGSVTSTMVADAVKEQFDIEIDRKRLEIKKPIKTSGAHVVPLAIYRDVRVDLNLAVGDENTFAELGLVAAEEAVEEAAEEAADAAEAVEEEAVAE